MKESTEENLLSITFDQSLSFKQHVKALVKRLAKNSMHMPEYHVTWTLKSTAMRAFILLQFSYCPVVWMFYDRTLEHRINRVQERALRIAYKDYGSDVGFLLEQTKSVTIHVRNLQLLMNGNV